MSEAVRGVSGQAYLTEMTEFANFSKAEQRYIRRSLDVGLERRDAIKRWARSPAEAAEIRDQSRHYSRLESLRGYIPEDVSLEEMEPLMATLVTLAAFDLGAGRLACFGSFRFLYERLLGAAVRPWLPGAFCAAAALPHLHPQRRRLLLQSISEAAATAPGWSGREPVFFPEWVEKVEIAVA